MNNYWINVMASAYSISGILLLAFGIFSSFLIILYIIGHNLFKQYSKVFNKIIVGFIIAFIFIILVYIFISPIN